MFKKMIVGYDVHGVDVAKELMAILKKMKIKAVVVEYSGDSSVDYVAITNRATKMFEEDSLADGLILICGTGVGALMLANRYGFVRAVLADSKQRAYYARRHENANCLVFAGGYDDGKVKVEPTNNIEEIIKAFAQTPFEGERHKARVDSLSSVGE